MPVMLKNMAYAIMIADTERYILIRLSNLFFIILPKGLPACAGSPYLSI